jgi:hypothetical protein
MKTTTNWNIIVLRPRADCAFMPGIRQAEARYSEPQQLQAHPSARPGGGRLLVGDLLRLREPRFAAGASRCAVALLTLLAISSSRLSTARAQGSLTPPGAPAPTMKSLDQIEARTPISAAPYTISQPGSYYLTGSLQVSSGSAITIVANGVTLDLNGFTISSTDPNNTGAGIQLGTSGRVQNVTILNGFITGSVGYGGGYSGPGFGNGITYVGAIPNNVRVTGVSVSGCLFSGIYINNGVVESCTVETVGGYGIVAVGVHRCEAFQCGNTAIYANTASDCYGYCLGNGDGVNADTANNCYANCTGSGNGVTAVTASNCRGESFSGDGVSASIATGCYGFSTSGHGLFADTAGNCRGESVNSVGVNAVSASNCYGQSDVGEGLNAIVATGCYGHSTSTTAMGLGLFANTAINCFGQSASGKGLQTVTAENCYGQGQGYGEGLIARTAIGCWGSSSLGVGLDTYIANSSDASSVNTTFHYNMPP